MCKQLILTIVTHYPLLFDFFFQTRYHYIGGAAGIEFRSAWGCLPSDGIKGRFPSGVCEVVSDMLAQVGRDLLEIPE